MVLGVRYLPATEPRKPTPSISIPVAQLALIITGFGAVLTTYYGLRAFQPVEFPA